MEKNSTKIFKGLMAVAAVSPLHKSFSGNSPATSSASAPKTAMGQYVPTASVLPPPS